MLEKVVQAGIAPEKKPTSAAKKRAELAASLPKSVSILGRTIKVTVTNLKGLHGDFSIDKSLIRIHQAVPAASAKDTLFHECLHAALAISGHNELMSEGQEEGLVRMLEHAFSQIVDVDKLKVDKTK